MGILSRLSKPIARPAPVDDDAPWHDETVTPAIEPAPVEVRTPAPSTPKPAQKLLAPAVTPLDRATYERRLTNEFAPDYGLGAHHPKRIIFADAETYFDADFSLKKMDLTAYIRDPRFAVLGWAVADDGADPMWMEEDEFVAFLPTLDMADTAFCFHNAAFDASIMHYHYGVAPALIIDTMCMSRGLLKHALGGKGSVGLENVAAHLGLGAKGDALASVAGMTLADLKKQKLLYDALKNYAVMDVTLMRGIFEKLRDLLPTSEYGIIHDTILMVTDPVFAIDTSLLVAHAQKVRERKDVLLARAGVDRSELMSNEKLAQAFIRLGVTPPKKISTKTGKPAWAFAKADAGFQALLEHEDETVRELAAARLGVKSTLEESRTAGFLAMAEATFDGARNYMPVQLTYCGAHTGRYSATGGLNLQNLPSRGDTTLRQSLLAPEGHLILAVDAAQIEARLAGWLGAEFGLLDLFENGADVYCDFASRLYDRTITKADKRERWAGKTAVLALQFGQGAESFMRVANTQAKQQGIDLQLDIIEAQRIVRVYRTTYKGIAGAWRELDSLLRLMMVGKADGRTFGPCLVEGRSFILPNGLKLNYHNLRFDSGGLAYGYGGVAKKLYGAKCFENVVQALDRVFVMDAWLAIKARCPRARLVNQVHDELVLIAPEDCAENYKQVALEEMRRRPVWGPDLPLDAEAHLGRNFGECK